MHLYISKTFYVLYFNGLYIINTYGLFKIYTVASFDSLKIHTIRYYSKTKTVH